MKYVHMIINRAHFHIKQLAHELSPQLHLVIQEFKQKNCYGRAITKQKIEEMGEGNREEEKGGRTEEEGEGEEEKS